MERKIGLSCSFALRNASSPQGYQSTGFVACCCKYGLSSADNLFFLVLGDGIVSMKWMVCLYKKLLKETMVYEVRCFPLADRSVSCPVFQRGCLSCSEEKGRGSGVKNSGRKGLNSKSFLIRKGQTPILIYVLLVHKSSLRHLF